MKNPKVWDFRAKISIRRFDTYGVLSQAILMMLQGKDKKLLISIQNALLEMINN